MRRAWIVLLSVQHFFCFIDQTCMSRLIDTLFSCLAFAVFVIIASKHQKPDDCLRIFLKTFHAQRLFEHSRSIFD